MNKLSKKQVPGTVYPSTLNMETIYSSEIFVIFQNTRRRISKNSVFKILDVFQIRRFIKEQRRFDELKFISLYTCITNKAHAQMFMHTATGQEMIRPET
jgi:hypothetical protein